jgi:SecD/SecF fusion protein
LIDEPDSDNRVDEALLKGLSSSMAASKPEIIRSSNVGPTIARDIKESAIKSIIFALLIMFGYIFFRFARWQFGLAALTSLTFNVIVVLGVFSLFGFLDVLPFSMEIDQAFIAAILTIVGYTINDTVIIFDRIRERIKANRANRSYGELFYTAIKETLSRTLVTSLTTLITALMLFLFAGEVLRPFMFGIILGIVVGTLSSIFLAAPLSLDLILKYESKTREKENLVAGTTA